ncbi:carbamoyl-phosphate synthase (glutamine-hydrolyzing) large subunit [Candidatus Karelsulcia muelleri]|uniref:Carbamoyl phosphate synthase large subunit n=1 Tax=Candidatus Karelsulcia muelleri PSPU TaxID=1189303 RepID=A0AAD1EXC2_9FLAO|nr:carbamoyl-phosphate synthase (glutamine-hydrolyzing) large subunit [Candidatus Karelsulcia muelleri]NJJ98637.1 carbamoyl-phosphate synthase (glutamine-hydrolyzing) large subunit [Candidatus Karelsulcia muelleri]BAO66295.1 carbamoyl phosphate synthase large subunit [Candidatus Karelsulcia muelleri PSPU]
MKLEKVLVIGSGALKIGEAGEFDYSGTQALKALKEENIFTILVNPNIATVQTSEKIADKIYSLPITPFFVEKIIEKEKPQGIFLSFGGQTALNCGIELYNNGVFKKNNVKVLGTPISYIIKSEDRDIFRKMLINIGINIAKSIAVNSVYEAINASNEIGFPLIIRSAYALGGLGSGFAKNVDELKKISSVALSYSSQILIEESLKGWKEIEYEVVRDIYDNCITVCNMENIDPIGIHTGDSIVVAPSQTLNNIEYNRLRSISIKIARYFNIIGECNVQFALSNNSDKYNVIEINARLSRSSALASKATGYPLAFIAAKLALGYGLHELKNTVTKLTYAFFEPALDYIVCKIPRWDLKKFDGVSTKIGSSMKSVGELMSIGGSFEEAIQKGLRMLDLGLYGFINPLKKKKKIKSVIKILKSPKYNRIEVLEDAFEKGLSVYDITNITNINPWFIYKLENIYKTKKKLKFYNKKNYITYDLLYKSKKQGFSDNQIAGLISSSIDEITKLSNNIRNYRKKKKIIPFTRQIDTLASEYPSKTNYLYLTYNGEHHDVSYSEKEKSIVILGSGVYRIGSSVEFDWCCVSGLDFIKKEGYRSVIINYNPETVSTDFDVCDRLYFEELSLERVLDIIELENPEGTVISMGGQIPNNLSLPLYKKKVKILGTSPIHIDEVEDRFKFSKSLDKLNILQPKWKELSNIYDVYHFINLVGFPIIIRPSYVLSGAAMNIVFDKKKLDFCLKKAKTISPKYPIVITKFIENAKEIELDAVANNGKMIYHAISEHIEYAGVHSGDATLVYPTQNISLNTIKKIKNISKKIAKRFNISGPFNIQFLYKKKKIKVIECNLRASRSFPFISKVSHLNMVELAMKVLLKKKNIDKNITNFLTIDYVGVKSSQFSFSRLEGSDPILGVDMVSTGEVGCLGSSFNEALIKSMLSVGYNIPKKNIFIYIKSLKNRIIMLDYIKLLIINNYILFSKDETYNFFIKNKIFCKKNSSTKKSSNIIDNLKSNKIDLIINIPYKNNKNDYLIRRAAINLNIPLLTNICLAKVFIKSFCEIKSFKKIYISHWNSYK